MAFKHFKPLIETWSGIKSTHSAALNQFNIMHVTACASLLAFEWLGSSCQQSTCMWCTHRTHTAYSVCVRSAV